MGDFFYGKNDVVCQCMFHRMSRALKKSLGAKSVVTGCVHKEGGAQNPFPIVGIGASAGGLEAFTQLLTHLPGDTGMAFVLVQHLDPTHPSQLASLLAKATPMPVLEIKDGMNIKPNQVYVIPPNKNLNLADGKLILAPRGKTRIANSVDHFFCSLAREHENCAIGVILSGTGSDGTVGLTEIKGAGGITFAQDEKSAKFSGMPAHATLDSVDFILPPEKIAFELARIGHDPNLALTPKAESEIAEAARTKEFLRILTLLRTQSGVDFGQYRDTTIKRRIQRRMIVRTKQTLAEYIELLEKDGDEISALFNDVLINVTSFFRDAEMFETLKTRIFPEILKAKPQIIRIWVAACSTGQEAYSIAIALLEFLEQKPNAPGIQIFATDIREAVIEKGRRGYYAEGIETEVSPERLRRFFTKEDGGYRISKTIRDLCVFAKQNVTADPPFSRMDLVSCRNLLIYLTPPLQRHVISTFHYALSSNGYLVLGNSETVGANSDLFELLDRKQKIYSKKGAAIRPFSHFAAQDLKSKIIVAGHNAPVHASAPADFQKEADRILLGRYAPAGVLVNSNLEVLQFRGRTSPFLEPPTGEASFNLLKMARENLALELGTAIREAKKKNATVQRNVRLHDHDKIRRVNLEVVPVKLSGSAENCFLVLFDYADKGRGGALRPAKKEAVEKEIPATEKNRELKRLRTELAAAREYLQAIIEQQDAGNEELKCANEEVLSSNEELQSTNEQLGTAKEELQSTNEELQTLNEELQTRNSELNQLNNDLSNLLASVRIPILMLGSDLRVRRFNPAAIELLRLKPAVIGRPIHSIDLPIVVRDLENSLLEVINKVAPREMEVRDDDGHWYSLRLNPYRTGDNRIDGVIMALVDIEALKHLQELQQAAAQLALNESEERFRIAANNAPVFIWISNADKSFTWFNKPWLEFTGRKTEQEIGNGWREGVHPDDLQKCLETFSQQFDARRNMKVEYRLRRRDGEYRWLLDQSVPNFRGTEFVGYIGSCIDITERKRNEEELTKSLEREKSASRAKDDFLAALSHELRTPLNPVLLIASDAAKNRELPPGIRANFETIRKNIELEARLIDDLLDLTRIVTGKLSLEKRDLDAHDVLRDALKAVKAEVGARQIRVSLKLKARQHYVSGDAARLQQVFWNVLKNAVKFTPRKGKIIVETSAANNGGKLLVRITDTGIGMTREELARAFAAFSQGDHARDSHRFGGLGLGLAISQKIIELHAGRIHAASKGRNQGASFTIELPFSPVKNKDSLPKKNPSAHLLPVQKNKGARILLVEDHEPTRNALANLLTRRQYKIQAAGSVAEARKIAAKEKIDFVISDIGLPDGSGNDLMRELCERYALKGIALTGYGMENDVQSSLAAGFVAHLTKPVHIQALEKVLAIPMLTGKAVKV
ncbi:MAG TPA: chemotaxis protein CheB [Verrucomicrobiae bacterium]|jgi:two-component system CheB/CheR fusion protein